MIGAPYHFHLGGPTDVLTQYYGDADAQAKAKCPHGLLEANPAPELLPIFFLVSEELPYSRQRIQNVVEREDRQFI